MSATNNRKALTASCFACLVVLLLAGSGCLGHSVNGVQKPNQSIPPTQRVTFVLRDQPKAKTVALAGTFNDWNIQKTPMTRNGGDWSVGIDLAPNRYQYKFVIDEERWTVDPENPQIEDDGNGHFNSVIVINAKDRSSNVETNSSKLERDSFHRRLDVGGYKLYINCEGPISKTTPVTIMDAGLGNSSESWLGIQPKIAKFARVCIYDRASLGNSDPTIHTQTTTQIVLDLHNLLDRAGIPGPLVLVGHSLGGINVRLYASTYPKEVVGLVLVDSAHEEQFARMDALIPEEIKKQFPPSALEIISNEKIDFTENSERRARLAKWHADIPLIVLTAANAKPDPPGPLAYLAPKFEQIRQELQQDLVHRSARGKQLIATKSGHYIQRDEPDLVVTAIREVINETRNEK